MMQLNYSQRRLLLPALPTFFSTFCPPFFALLFVMAIYFLFPFKEIRFSITHSTMFIYIILSLNVYPVLISGWASNRKYALVGSLRAVAQTVSYEVRLALILIFFFSLRISLTLYSSNTINRIWVKIIVFVPLIGIWLISCVAETNRTPFDFAEGESELVSGFNIEYGRLGFALIFIAEYARIIFIRCIFVILFLSNRSLSFAIYTFTVILVRVWIWLRSTFPRYRYDKLIDLAWKTYLPLSLMLIPYRVYCIASFSGR